MKRGQPFTVDARTLARSGASRLLAVAAGTIGATLTLPAERPTLDAYHPTDTREGRDTYVAVLDIMGPLAQRGEHHICGFLDGYDWIADRLEEALEDRDVSAVVLRLDSPGGDVAGLEEGIRRMCAARDRAGKPIVAYVDEFCASAAYWIAASLATAGIVLPPSAGVGSIGVLGAIVDVTGALAKDGVGVIVVRDPAGKAPSLPESPLTELATSRLQSEISAASGRFAAAVATARGLTPDDVRALDGAVLCGAEAVAGGLANLVGGLDDAIALAADAAAQGDSHVKNSAALVALAAAVGLSDFANPDRIAALALERLKVGASTPPRRAEDEPPKPPEEKPKPAAGTVTCPECGHEFEAPTDGGGEKPPEDAAAKARAERKLGANVKALTGETDADAAFGVVLALRAGRADDAKAAEARERDELVVSLIKAGHETPATAWEDPLVAGDLAKRKPSSTYASQSIASLRAFVRTKLAIPAAFRAGSPAQAVNGGGELTAREIERCKAEGIPVEKYLATKAAIDRRSSRQ